MDSSLWSKYVAGLFFVLQGALWITLYSNQVTLNSRLDELQFNHGSEHRAKRDVRVASESRNLLEGQNISYYSSLEITEPPVARPTRRKHRKNHRPTVEKYYSSMESTTAEPMMIRSSRTKSTMGSKAQLEDQIPNRDVTKTIAYLSSSREEQTLNVPPTAIHFVSDASNYTRERHSHYAGNGRIKVSGIYKDWRPASWSHKLGTTQLFPMNQGTITISQSGLYMLYAQIHYSNQQEVNCYRALHNGDVVAQCCSTTAHPNKHEVKANTCSLMTTLYLLAGDKIWLTDLHERYVILTPEKSYFGLVQLYQQSPSG